MRGNGKQPNKAKSALICCKCQTTSGAFSKYLGGYVCDECADTIRLGSDTTTKALRAKQRSNRAARALELGSPAQAGDSDQLEYVAAAGHLLASEALDAPVQCLPLAGGELAAQSTQPDKTLTASVVALEASNERVQLVSSLGNDIAALALDTAESVGAKGSIEQMLAHQAAVAHHHAMTLLSKATVEPDPSMQLQYSALAAKWMAASSNAALTLKKLKTNGEQHITIQHVTVSGGGQAVIGDVRTGGGQCNS